MKKQDLYSLQNLVPQYQPKNLIQAVIEKYELLGLTKHQFCKLALIDRKTWGRILEGDHQKFDVPMLLKLAQFLEVDIHEAIDMYVEHTQDNINDTLDIIKKNNFLTNYFDLKTLKRIGFIKSIQDYNNIEERIKEFFQIENIREEYLFQDARPLFSRSRIKSSNKMLLFWNKIVLEQIKSIHNPYPYDEKKLMTIIPKIRAATLDLEHGFNRFIQAIFECGVTVIVETYISKTAVKGGTFSYKEKPYIVLTNIYKKYPTLWFTLAHEICHVLKDFDYITHQGYHITGVDDLLTDELQEEIADNFAERLFLSEENAKFIEKYITIDEIVNQYANKWNVHKSFIYARYLKNNNDKKEWNKYQKYLISSSPAIKNIEVQNPWTKRTIQETVETISRSLYKKPMMISQN